MASHDSKEEVPSGLPKKAAVVADKKYLDPTKVLQAAGGPGPGNLLVHVYRDMQGISVAPDPFNPVLQKHYRSEESRANTTIINRSSYYVTKAFLDNPDSWQS